MLFDQIAKLAVQILKPEAAPDSSQFAQPWTPPQNYMPSPLGFRGAGRADQYGPVPDSFEV